MVCALRIKSCYIYFIVIFAVMMSLPSVSYLYAFNFFGNRDVGPVLGGFYGGLNCTGPSLLVPGAPYRVPIELPSEESSRCQFEALCAADSFNFTVANSSLAVIQFSGSANCSVVTGAPPPLAVEFAPLPPRRGCVAFPASNRSAWVNPLYPLDALASDPTTAWANFGDAVYGAIPTSFYFAAILIWLLNTTSAPEDQFPILLAPWMRAAAKRGAVSFSCVWLLLLVAAFLIGFAKSGVVPFRGGPGAFCSLEFPYVELDDEWLRVVFAVELASVLAGLAAAQLWYLSAFGFCHGGTTTSVPVIALMALFKGARNTPLRCLTCRRPPGTWAPQTKLPRMPGTISLPATAMLFAAIGALRALQELVQFTMMRGTTAPPPTAFPEPTRALLYAGCACAFAGAALLVVSIYDVRGVPAVGGRPRVLWLLPEPEEYANPPPLALQLSLPPRELLLKHLGPVDTAARLGSCLECWLAAPRRRCPRADAGVDAAEAELAEVNVGAQASSSGGSAGDGAPPRSAHLEPQQCAMCYETYEPGAAAAGAWLALVCGHVFHTVCIMRWAAHQAASGNHVHCPLDRVLVSVAAPRGRFEVGRGVPGDESWLRGRGGVGWRSTLGRVAALPPPGFTVLTPVVAPAPSAPEPR
jgi:hypothetical protein